MVSLSILLIGLKYKYMKIDELENLMREGKLAINKRKLNIQYRDKGWRGQKWDDTTNGSWDTTQIPYQMYQYEAHIKGDNENLFYKLRKRDYEKFNKIIPEIYYYKGNKLFNIKKCNDLSGHDFFADWVDKNEGNKQKYGKFYLKELTTLN